MVSPITVIWKPRTCSDGNEPASRPESSEQRVVWLRVHPSAFDVVSSSLQLTASLTLDAAKRSSDGEMEELEVEIADLRGQINIFEITGPKSNQVLRGALSPVHEDQRIDFQKVCYSSNHLPFSSDLHVA